MKPVCIEFVQSRRWRAVWGVSWLATVALVAVAGWLWLQRNGQTGELNTRIEEVKSQIQLARTPAVVASDPRKSSTEHAIRFLRTDYNKVFAVVENLNEPGARLRALSFDASSNTLRLEYDLDTVVKASVVTAALNDGYEARPWKLESVNATNGLVVTGVSLAAPVAMYRGVWTAVVERL
jgi:hypothetical protein